MSPAGRTCLHEHVGKKRGVTFHARFHARRYWKPSPPPSLFCPQPHVTPLPPGLTDLASDTEIDLSRGAKAWQRQQEAQAMTQRRSRPRRPPQRPPQSKRDHTHAHVPRAHVAQWHTSVLARHSICHSPHSPRSARSRTEPESHTGHLTLHLSRLRCMLLCLSFARAFAPAFPVAARRMVPGQTAAAVAHILSRSELV